jgi:hypothetical protein
MNPDGNMNPDGGSQLPPIASCTPAAGGGSSMVSMPQLLLTLKDGYEEAWQGGAAVADLNKNGKQQIIVPRGAVVDVWNADGSLAWRYDTQQSRIWSSAVVADFLGDGNLEIGIAAYGNIYLLNASGQVMPGFPVTWQTEMRSLGAGDVDGDGKPELIVSLANGSATDILQAYHGNGSPVTGFPPNATGSSLCSTEGPCYLAGCYDQNLAVGDLNGDGKLDLVAPMDDAYATFNQGSGATFAANSIYPHKLTSAVRYLHALSDSEQGYANDEMTALQSQFTNTAPAIADIDGDGSYEIVMLGGVQNAAQTNTQLGVALWAVHPDASRLAAWQTPFYVSQYLSGLTDPGNNIVAATNQVTVADIDSKSEGPELLFAGFDGKIHAVSAASQELWNFTYTTDPDVLTGGVVVGDLSGDGIPEVVFNTYSIDQNKSNLFILDASGNQLYSVALPSRGAMPLPTLADINGDGTVEVIVSLKDAVDMVQSVLVYTVPGSSTNCLLWPTSRHDLLRSAWVR